MKKTILPMAWLFWVCLGSSALKVMPQIPSSPSLTHEYKTGLAIFNNNPVANLSTASLRMGKDRSLNDGSARKMIRFASRSRSIDFVKRVKFVPDG